MQFQNLRHRTDGSIEGRYYHEKLSDWVAFTAKDGSELWASVYAEPDAVAQLAKAQAQARPTYPTVEDARDAMVAWIDGFLTQIAGVVPAFERASWPSKAEAARAVVAGSARPDQTAMIAAEAEVQGKTNADMAQKIIEKATAYEAVVARAAGLRVNLENALEAETDPLKYDEILKGGEAQAIALAASLGITIENQSA